MRSPKFRRKDVTTCTWGLRLREAPRPQAIARGGSCFPANGTASAPRNSTRFSAPYPARGLPCERFKLSLAASPCITRGRRGWQALRRGRLAPPILSPASLAHSGWGQIEPRTACSRTCPGACPSGSRARPAIAHKLAFGPLSAVFGLRTGLHKARFAPSAQVGPRPYGAAGTTPNTGGRPCGQYGGARPWCICISRLAPDVGFYGTWLLPGAKFQRPARANSVAERRRNCKGEPIFDNGVPRRFWAVYGGGCVQRAEQ